MSNLLEFGSEFDWNSTMPYLKNKKRDILASKGIKSKIYLRSGRDALRYIARSYKGIKTSVLMPALTCCSMSEPFYSEGYNVQFYKLTRDFRADIDDIKSKIKPNTIFLFMNFFANPTLSKVDLEKILCFADGVISVEDITHDFIARDMLDCFADITACSIRKWFSVPDGGILFSRNKLPKQMLEKDTLFADKRISAMKNKSRYLEDLDINEKDCFRNELSEANYYIDTVNNIAEIDCRSQEIIEHTDFEEMREKRAENIKALFNELRSFKNIDIINQDYMENALYFPVLVNNQLECQKVWATHGLYAPIIWPLHKDAEGVCKTADYVSKHILALPCDHRYDTADMGTIISIIRKFL